MLDTLRPHLVPAGRIVSAWIHNGQPSDIESVMVDGHFIMRSRKVLTMDARIASSRRRTGWAGEFGPTCRQRARLRCPGDRAGLARAELTLPGVRRHLLTESPLLREHFRGELGAEVLRLEDLPNFDLGFAGKRVGAALHPLDGLFL